MLKGFLKSLMGRARETVANNTDLTYAGRERVRDLNQSIERLIDQRNRVAGEGVLAEGKYKAASKEEEKFLDAVKHWKKEGEEDKAKRAYEVYTKAASEVARREAEIQTIKERVEDLDQQIVELNQELSNIESSLSKAAADQQYGKSMSQAEDIHRDMRSGGDLNDAMQASERRLAEAKASRDRRKANSQEDLLPPPHNPKIKPLSEI